MPTARLVPTLKKSAKTELVFSIINPNADFYAMNITPLPHGVKYTLDGKDFTLKLIGQFNVSNALAAIAACSLLGIDKFDAAQALRAS